MSLTAPLGTFAEAIAWAKSRGVVLPDEFYGDLQDQAKAKAFTVSGLASLGQIQATLDSLTAALEAGEAFESWQAKAGDLLGSLPDGRMETIFRNFIQNAYNGGRWQQFERNKANRPYLMFSAINDNRTTEICRKRNGIIRPVDDPFWKRNSPACHHRCRSTLISLSERQAKDRSRDGEGTNKPEPTDKPADGWGHKPLGDDLAAGLAQAIADGAKAAPLSWLTAIIAFFTAGWSKLTGWLAKLL